MRRRYGTLSIAMTRLAPCRYALVIANCPTGPQPHTATVSPGLMLHCSAAMYPVGSTSDRKSACSSVTSSGTFNGPKSANGTRAYSACPPAKPPVMCPYPKIPHGE